jgi:hypothetical protein
MFNIDIDIDFWIWVFKKTLVMANDEACYLFVGSYRVCILVVAKRILTSSQLRRSNEIKKKVLWERVVVSAGGLGLRKGS